MIIYKYLDAKRIDVLRSSHISFTQSSSLNDPFDTAPVTALHNYSRLIHEIPSVTKQVENVGGPPELIDVILGYKFNEREVNFRHMIDENHAFLCLSRRSDNLLMWSHYADYHRGYVIGFDTESNFFNEGYGTRYGLRDISYSNKRPNIPAAGLDSLPKQEGWDIQTAILFTKSADWRYEKEVRFIAHPNDSYRTKKVRGKPDIHLYKFPLECVREIILGCRMSAANKEKLLRASTKYRNARLFEAELHDLEYRMSIFPYIP